MKIATLALTMMIGLSQSAFTTSGLAQERAELSPRDFCQAAGGRVDRSDHADVIVCCYEKAQTCILSNVQGRYSRRIPNTPEGRDAALVQEARGTFMSE